VLDCTIDERLKKLGYRREFVSRVQ
jgi:hypothetical protein